MRYAKTLAIVSALGLGLIFSFPHVARAKKPVGVGNGGEPQTGGLPALEDRVEALEGVVASTLHRLSAEFQNFDSGVSEIETTAAPLAGGLGGLVTYSKTLSIPFDVVYVTFSAQGDTHGGAALSLSANITDAAAVRTVCQPMAGSDTGGGGTAGPNGWMTLNKLPTNPTVDTTGPANNCNDGAGGSADCHDNTIMFSCCLRITPDTASTKHTVEIRLGSQPNPLTPTVANEAFYERSTIYIDASADPGGSLCSGVGTANH
jgi:hypothetical protein